MYGEQVIDRLITAFTERMESYIPFLNHASMHSEESSVWTPYHGVLFIDGEHEELLAPSLRVISLQHNQLVAQARDWPSGNPAQLDWLRHTTERSVIDTASDIEATFNFGEENVSSSTVTSGRESLRNLYANPEMTIERFILRAFPEAKEVFGENTPNYEMLKPFLEA